MDPGIITHDVWAGISGLVRPLWLLVPLVALFGGSLLMSLAIIPSSVTTGDLPERALKLRAPLYVVAAIAFVGLMTDLVVVLRAAGIIGQFWPRWWI